MKGRTSAELEKREGISILSCLFSSRSDPLKTAPDFLAAHYSDSNISIFDAKIFEKIGNLDQKLLNTSNIFGFSLNGYILSLGCADETNCAAVKCFDLRVTLNKTSIEFDFTNLEASATCMASSLDQGFVAVGTELPIIKKKSKKVNNNASTDDEEEDPTPSIFVYDLRNTSKTMNTYTESHSDDITGLVFHPTSSSHFASSGSDGLINIFDLRESSEDDALIQSLNCTSSIQKLGWAQNQVCNQTELTTPHSGLLYSITDDRRFRLWDPFEGDEILAFDSVGSESGAGLQPIASFPFSLTPSIISTFSSSGEGRLSVANWSPRNDSMETEPKTETLKLKDFKRLEGSVPQTTEVIRSADYDMRSQVLVTGSDCGVLSATSLQLESETPTKLSKKKKANRTPKSRSSRPY